MNVDHYDRVLMDCVDGVLMDASNQIDKKSFIITYNLISGKVGLFLN